MPDDRCARLARAQKLVDDGQPMLTPSEAAQMVGLTKEQLLERVRRGRGPRMYKLGQRTLRFARQDIDEWLKGHAKSRALTSDEVGALLRGIGDRIDRVMQERGVSFPEAVKIIAEENEA